VNSLVYVSAAGVLDEDIELVRAADLLTIGKDLEVIDVGDLGSESLTDYNDLTDDADWDYTGEVAAVSTDAVYTYASSGNGTITQTNAQMAVVGVGYRWYKAVHVVSGSTVAGATVTITSAFASAATALDVSDGTNTTYFQAASGAAAADFVIDITGATSGAFTLESISIKEVQGGDVIASGLYTGGGPTGIKVLADGKVCVGCDAPGSLFHVFEPAAVDAVVEFESDTDDTYLILNSKSQGNTQIVFAEADTNRWYVGLKGNDNTFRIGTTDGLASSVLHIELAGPIGLGPLNIAPTHTAGVLDRTPTTGATTFSVGWDGTNASATTTNLLVRTGASQGTTPLTSWWVGGNMRALVSEAGNIALGSTRSFRWSSTSGATGVQDLAINRNDVETLEINGGVRGIAGFGDLILRDLELVDVSSLAAESLADPGFPNGTNWAEVGDFATPAGTAVYTDSAHSGTLTQTAAQMDIPGVPNRWYVAEYDVSSQSGDPACTITTAFAAVAETLTIADGSQINYFLSAAAPANFIISCTSSSGGFVMDDITLKEVIGGDITVNGDAHIKSLATYNGQATAGVGQPAILGSVSVTGASSAVGATNIVASAAAGMYRLSGYMQTTTQGDGGCLSDVTFVWTYNSDAKALEVVSNHDQEVDETYSQIPPTIVRSDGAANITYAISLDAGGDCTNAVFDYYLTAERIQ
jgi:hypothetical protein